MSTKSLEQLIGEKAYEIFQRREREGRSGDSEQDWHEAVKEVMAEQKKKDGPAKAKSAAECKVEAAKKAAPAPAPVAVKAEVKAAPAPAPVAAKAEVKAAPAPAKVEPKAAPKAAPAPVKKAAPVVAAKKPIAKKGR